HRIVEEAVALAQNRNVVVDLLVVLLRAQELFRLATAAVVVPLLFGHPAEPARSRLFGGLSVVAVGLLPLALAFRLSASGHIVFGFGFDLFIGHCSFLDLMGGANLKIGAKDLA